MSSGWLAVVAGVIGIFASSGFWLFFTRILDKRSATTKMLLGLGHDRLVTLCKFYLVNEEISPEEYKNLYNYLYIPYKDLKGDGMVDALMEKVKQLPFV